jgi:hypothetical protein
MTDALSVPCPECKRPAGSPCITLDTHEPSSLVHRARARVATGSAGERDRWQALKDYLAERIDADETVRAGLVEHGETKLSGPFGGLVSANRSTLAKMLELETGK